MHAVRNIVYIPHKVYMYLIGREGQSVSITYYSNVVVLVRLINGLLRQYCTLVDNKRPSVKEYIDKVILAQLKIIYYTYLVDRKCTKDNIFELRSLDDLLLTAAPDLFKASDFHVKSRFFTYHYVALFRHPSILNTLKTRLFFVYVWLAKQYSHLTHKVSKAGKA